MTLTMKNFSFKDKHFLQIHGTAVGTRMAPSYANLSMGKFEQQAIENAPCKHFDGMDGRRRPSEDLH